MVKIRLSILSAVIIGVVLICLAPLPTNCDKEIPATKFSQNVDTYGATLTVLYCYSCGYRKAFEDYSNILHEKYPEISIRGGNYEPSGFNMYLSKAILVTKLILIIALVSSFDIFGYLGQRVPDWWGWCTENKLYACMMIFFLGNMLEAQVRRLWNLPLSIFISYLIAAYLLWRI
jgi:selT/selW/selH-like putative selenoprotein